MWFWEQFKPKTRVDDAVAQYRRLEYVGSVSPNTSGPTKNTDRTLNYSGDHFTVVSITGALPIYVRLGPDPNPFIRLHERMVITRPFQQVTFRVGNVLTETAIASLLGVKVVAFTSHGPLIQFGPKSYGIRRNPLMLYGLSATTANTDLSNILRKSGGAGFATLGKGGGTLLVTNTDASNDLYIVPFGSYNQTLAAGTRGYGPVRPGQSVSLQLEDVVTATADAPDAGGLVIKTLTGTCAYSIIASSGEMDEAEGEQATVHTPSMT